MKLVLLFGPQAVGKMTVGEELEKMTELKLFHNHMAIEFVTPFFSYGTAEGKRLVNLFRQEIFEAVSNSSLYGLIFTYVWAFDQQEDWDYVAKLCSTFEEKGGTVYLVELEASLQERLKRNKSGHRLQQKPTKRDVEWSENELKSSMLKYRLNSEEGEIRRDTYLRIDNTKLRAEETARIIKVRFGL
ncbi:AAA family ATPase [Bacillus marinisedimentorum]|uniref:AAA family ATPase n=1 Tax=Bacillus marinisedimentorum TaxID=1821260 RepID=UPI0007E194DF|nr:AAA family ATPase [Bacillus marinisedimentorum]